MKKVVVLLANGFEEIEAVSCIDIMRRGGLSVTLAAVGCHDLVVSGANKIKILSDKLLREVEPSGFDAIVLPGGYDNAQTLAHDELAQMVIKKFHTDRKLVAAICAAPIALDAADVITGNYACYPGVEENIQHGICIKNEKVVIADNVLTSRGPGTAICFGLAIVENLIDATTAQNIKHGVLADFC